MPTRSIPPRALALLVLLTLVWGTNWPLFALAVAEVSVWTFRAVSVTLAGAVLLAVARARGQSLAIARRHWPAIAAATFFYLFVWNIASTYAAVLIPSGQAAVLGFTMPLWSALISWAVLGERLSLRLVVAVLLGGTAVVLLMVPSFAAYANAPLGLAAGLASGLGWAIGTLILKRSGVAVPATVLTGWQLLLVAVPITVTSAPSRGLPLAESDTVPRTVWASARPAPTARASRTPSAASLLDQENRMTPPQGEKRDPAGIALLDLLVTHPRARPRRGPG